MIGVKFGVKYRGVVDGTTNYRAFFSGELTAVKEKQIRDKITSLYGIGFAIRWICHVDDDMYINIGVLTKMLAKLNESEPIYFGRSGTPFDAPRPVFSGEILGIFILF